MPTITEKQKRKYLNGGYSQCPKCKGDDIDGDSIEVDSGHCWQTCHCSNCGLSWNDVYKIVDIEIIDEE